MFVNNVRTSLKQVLIQLSMHVNIRKIIYFSFTSTVYASWKWCHEYIYILYIYIYIYIVIDRERARARDYEQWFSFWLCTRWVDLHKWPIRKALLCIYVHTHTHTPTHTHTHTDKTHIHSQPSYHMFLCHLWVN